MEIEGNAVNHLKNLQPPAGGSGDGDPDPPPPPSHLSCPRCHSYNTKFCYFNNNSKVQPRYYCRDCRRHWTHGGTLRNVPIGGNRRNRRALPAAAAPGQVAMAQFPEIPAPPPPPMMSNAAYVGGSFLPAFPPNQYGANLSLLQAMTIQSLRSPAAGNLLPPQPHLNNQPFGPWAPNVNNAGPSFAGEGPSFLDEAGPFGAPNQWEEDHQG